MPLWQIITIRAEAVITNAYSRNGIKEDMIASWNWKTYWKVLRSVEYRYINTKKLATKIITEWQSKQFI